MNTQSEIFGCNEKIMRLCVEEIREEGKRLVANLDGEPTIVGRSEECGVVIDSTAVSSEHGVFRRFDTEWGFKDLGSTNGSWINEKKLTAGVWYLLRSGDHLQIADQLLRLKDLDAGEAPSPRSLLVFARGEYVGQYHIPTAGRALVVGGAKADLKLDIDVHELPSLVVERRGEILCAFSITRETVAYCNGKEIATTMIVNDRDFLAVGQYQILVCDPPQSRDGASHQALAGNPSTPDYSLEQLESHLSGRRVGDWEDESETNRERLAGHRLPFGTEFEADGSQHSFLDEWQSGDGSLAPGMPRETPRSSHFMIGNEPEPKVDLLEDKIILIIGSVLVGAVVIVLSIWLLA